MGETLKEHLQKLEESHTSMSVRTSKEKLGELLARALKKSNKRIKAIVRTDFRLHNRFLLFVEFLFHSIMNVTN